MPDSPNSHSNFMKTNRGKRTRRPTSHAAYEIVGLWCVYNKPMIYKMTYENRAKQSVGETTDSVVFCWVHWTKNGVGHSLVWLFFVLVKQKHTLTQLLWIFNRFVSTTHRSLNNNNEPNGFEFSKQISFNFV